MSPNEIVENCSVRLTRSIVGSDVIANGRGCYKLIDRGTGRGTEVHQVLLARRIDAEWVQVTLFDVETGTIQDWRCGAFTPVYVVTRGKFA